MTRSPGSRPLVRGSTTTIVASICMLLAIVVFGMVLLPNNRQFDPGQSADLYIVKRGDFAITIPTSGELLAREQIEIRNQLESRAVITEIIDEGTYVEQGDMLVRFNDEDIRSRIKDAEDAVNSARSELIAAEAALAIGKSTRDSDIDRALLDLKLAELALDAWREGEVESMRQQLELAVERTQNNFDRLKQRVKDSQQLFEREFISRDELERDRIAKIEAEADLLQARTELEVYNQYTYKQEHALKHSDVEQARAELERVEQRHAAEIARARADVDSKLHQLASREERLADLQEQLELTVVRAPSAGLVVYASSLEHRRGWTDPPDVGTELARNEFIMVLPDTSRMIAAVKVNEALSGLVLPGQHAIVVPDAISHVSYEGEVLSIGVLAESGGWRDPSRREYTVRILLKDIEGYGLRPSMRCKANIFVDEVKNALYVPLQAVFRDGRDAFVYVPERDGFAVQHVRIGKSSELYVEVLDGLDEGDRVLLRKPSSGKIHHEHRRPHKDAAPISDPQQELAQS